MCYEKKRILIVSATLLFSISFSPLLTNAESKIPSEFSSKKYTGDQEIIEGTNGVLDGQMVPYITGLPFTGNVTLHFSAKNPEFKTGYVSVIMFTIPEEFQNIAASPDFLNRISGKIKITTPLGHNEISISKNQITQVPNKLIINIPDSIWMGDPGNDEVGTVSCDMVISYGEILATNPSFEIPDAPNGYTFTSKLKYSTEPWDFINDPLNSTPDETFITNDTSATNL